MWLLLCLSSDQEVLAQLELLTTSAPEFYRVDHAFSITEAAQWNFARKHHVFVLDSVRPGMSSFGMCGLVRSTDPDAVIIFMSESEGDMADAMNSGANIFLVKPRQTKMLRKTIDDLLDGNSQQNRRQKVF